MKFGIIGTGVISRFHAQAIQALPQATLAGIAGRTPESSSALAEEFGTRAHASIDALLADPAIDVVTICTPSGQHRESAIAALRAGKHVVVEKPMEISTERIDEMKTVAQQCGRTLAGILNRRFQPGVEATRRAVATGRLGRLTSASIHLKWFRSQDYYDSGAWRGTWELDGGGVLMNQGIHSIDLLLHLVGPVRAVQAQTACLAHERIEVEDHAVALLEFANGARGVIEASTATWSSRGHPARIQLAGTMGSIFLADEHVEVWDFADPEPDDERIRRDLAFGSGTSAGGADPKAISSLQHERNLAEILAAIEEDREPATSALEARRAVELIQAIYRSARAEGARVELRESV